MNHQTIRVTFNVNGINEERTLTGTWQLGGQLGPQQVFVLDHYIILGPNEHVMRDEGDLILGGELLPPPMGPNLPLSHGDFEEEEGETLHGFYSTYVTDVLEPQEEEDLEEDSEEEDTPLEGGYLFANMFLGAATQRLIAADEVQLR